MIQDKNSEAYKLAEKTVEVLFDQGLNAAGTFLAMNWVEYPLWVKLAVKDTVRGLASEKGWDFNN